MVALPICIYVYLDSSDAFLGSISWVPEERLIKMSWVYWFVLDMIISPSSLLQSKPLSALIANIDLLSELLCIIFSKYVLIDSSSGYLLLLLLYFPYFKCFSLFHFLLSLYFSGRERIPFFNAPVLNDTFLPLLFHILQKLS